MSRPGSCLPSLRGPVCTLRLSDSELLGVVRDVCRHVNSVRPRSVSQSAFNNGRAEAGHPQAPTAARICTRLTTSWEQVKAAALDRKRSHALTAGSWKRTAHDPAVGKPACIFALQRVAVRRGSNWLSRGGYDETAAELRAEDARRRHGSGVALPTANQIVQMFKSWKKALKAAGLHDDGSHRNDALRGIACVDAIELALETKGALPTSPELEQFMRVACRLRLEKRRIPHPDAVEELRQRRAASRPPKWTPPGYPPKAQRPNWAEPLELGGPPRHSDLSGDEIFIQYLMRFLLESDRHPRTVYVAWAARTPGAPSASSMARFGRPGYAAYRAEARERLRRGERPTV